MDGLSPSTYVGLRAIHGLLAVLGVAVLMHPVVALWRRKALTVWTRRTAWIAAALIASPFALGWLIYPTYRRHPKVRLWQADSPALLAFESKEHLAAICLALTLGGALTLQFGGATLDGRKTARTLLLAAWICGLISTVIGVYVGAASAPAW